MGEDAIRNNKETSGSQRLPLKGCRQGLQIVVGARETREYILTNKEKAYFAGETGTTNTRSYAGLIVELHKFLEGWDLMLGDVPLSSWGLRSACVLPQSMTREYVIEQTTETVFLADRENILLVSYSSNHSGRASFEPRFDIRSIWEEGQPEYETRWDAERRVLALRRTDHTERTDQQDYPVWVAVACDRPAEFVPHEAYRRTTYTKDAARRAMASAVPYSPGRLEFTFESDEGFAGSVTFCAAVGDTLDGASELALKGLHDEFSLYDDKMRRTADLLDGAGIATHDNDYHLALQWAAASVDALIMNQLGRGIFAGLHWFPNYWGRDTFIALPGACLVRGEFDTAREILESFALLQETDEDSLLFGRIPNLAMPGEVYYNTADGTWWFVREAYEYLRYTGDLEFAERFMPVIERAIDGALARRTDADGFLLHGTAETWMDAGGETSPFSPRGNRAVEVQVLWHTALISGAAIADALGREEQASSCRESAELVGGAFLREFPDPSRDGLFDHLDPDGAPDRQIRPNQVFAATVPWDDLLPRKAERAMLELVRESCVLRHGVTTLYTEDPGFHPCHLDLERYHFDEAYHNGDVWVWLTGPVVSALVKHGLVAAAWDQTSVLANMMFDEGAAGTLPELRDGVPPEHGENVAGAVSQAWSLSEFLRNFYQDYLGVRPNVLAGTVDVRPALPPSCSWMAAPVRVGEGSLFVLHRVDAESGRACTSVVADADAPPLTVRFTPRAHPDADVQEEGETLEAVLVPGGSLRFTSERSGGAWTTRLAGADEDTACAGELP
ncbi:MAG: amylo-alpha-1,6-glucosidase [Candidatus Eisenbacteria bacterium]